MKILVIFTGGTIGSCVGTEYIGLDTKTRRALIENYISKHRNDVEFETAAPYNILSENLSASELNTLVKCVADTDCDKYDGIIVTHGTDTLQYSAAALDLTVGDKPLPILLVSANRTIDNPASNGNINFEAAVEFIKAKAANGVFVSYKNTDDETVVFHRSDKLLMYAESLDGVHSLDKERFAEYKDGKVTVNSNAPQKAVVGPVTFCDTPNILVIQSRPGDSFDYDIKNTSAVIMLPYHSGTLDTESSAFRRFCQRAKEKALPIFVTAVSAGTAYESTKLFSELSLIPLPCRSFIPVYIRLWIAVSRGEDIKNIKL